MENELMNKKKRLMLLTFLITFLFAKKGVPVLIHLFYLIIIACVVFCRIPSFLTIPTITADSLFLLIMGGAGWIGFILMGLVWCKNN